MATYKFNPAFVSFMLLATLFAFVIQICVIRNTFEYTRIRQKERKWQIRQFAWMDRCQTLETANKDILRCKSRDMGCYKAPRFFGAAVHEVISTFKDRESSHETNCMNGCNERKFDFVEMFNERCYCMSSPDFGRLTANCEDHSVSRVKSVEYCERGVSDSSLQSSKLGCVEVPSDLSGNTAAIRMLSLTTEMCYLACESRGFVLASPLPHLNICICSDLVSMFENVERMMTKLRDCDEVKTSTAKYAQHMPLFRTAAFDELCDRREFLPPSVKSKIGLLSCPGAGNTWMRHLIEVATGYYTGSIYNDASLARGGFVGEKWPVHAHPGVIAIKAHRLKEMVYDSAIVLIRNPYHAKAAEYTRRTSHNHTGQIPGSMYRDVGFENVMRNTIWRELPVSALRNVRPVLVVFYEDVVNNPVQQLRRIVNFLPEKLHLRGQQLERRLMCVNLDPAGKFKREKVELKYNPITDKITTIVENQIREVNKTLLAFKQPLLPSAYLSHKWMHLSNEFNVV